jgi:hypothetical protein
MAFMASMASMAGIALGSAGPRHGAPLHPHRLLRCGVLHLLQVLLRSVPQGLGTFQKSLGKKK